MRLSQLIDHYIAKNSGTRWKSPNTVKVNSGTLRILLREIGWDPLLEEVDDRIILKAIEGRWDKTLSTHAQNYNRIKTFLTWSQKRGFSLGDVDSIVDTTAARIPDLDKKYLTYAEMKHTVKTARALGNDYWAGLVEFAYWSHRRESEIFSMKRQDVDLTPRSNMPHGVYWFTEEKASKGRQMLDLLPEEAECLKIWISCYEKEMGGEIPPSAYLFPATRPVGEAIKGLPRARRLVPFSQVRRQSQPFADAYKVAGVYEPGKAGHAARRGGEEDTFVALEEAGVPDPIPVICERSKQTPETARQYLNRKASAERSRKAYALISGRRGQERNEDSLKSPNAQERTNVVMFRPRSTQSG